MIVKVRLRHLPSEQEEICEYSLSDLATLRASGQFEFEVVK